MTPTEQAADRVKALVDRLRGRPYVRTADASERLMVEAADALTALQARVGELEGALGEVRQTLIDHGNGTCGRNCEAEYSGDVFFADEIAVIDALLTPPLEQE